MTTTTLTLTDFLLARIAEDEDVAQRALDAQGSPALISGMLLTTGDGFSRLDIAPARVLAECEAKRRIVEEAQRHEADVIPYGLGVDDSARYALDTVVRLLALPYTDHPDYREEWRA